MLYALILLATTIFSSLHAINLTLRTHDQSLTQQAQKHFKIILTVENGDRDTGNANINGLKQLNIINEERSNNIVFDNGNYSSTITYAFTVEAPQPGNLTIGPATVRHNGQDIASNTLNLSITPAGTAQQTPSGKPDDAVTFSLASNKNKVVAGEPIEVVATLRSSKPLAQANIGKFEHADFTIKEVLPPQQRNETKNGIAQIVLEKKYLLTPHKAGIFSLGPINMDIAVVTQQRKNLHGSIFDDSFFNELFGNRTEVMHLQTSPVSITVKPLPTEHLDGVGIFTRYDAHLSASEASVNEPITLIIELEGSADLDHITVPKLRLPHAVKYYESKNDTIPLPEQGTQAGKKHFEFIIQANRPGSLEIPAQTFTYFDYETHKTKELQTKPLLLNVTGKAMPAETSPSDDKNADEADAIKENKLAQTTVKKTSLPPSLPWWLFAFLLIIPLLFFIRPATSLIRQLIKMVRSKHADAAAISDTTLKALVKQNDLFGIYTFFMAFIAAQNNLTADSITMDIVETYCLSKHLSQEKTDDFITFLGQCSSGKYSHTTISTIEKDALLKKAHYWLLTLKT